MPYRWPADTNPNTWYKAAQRIDQAHLTNEAFQSMSCSAPSAPLKTASTQLSLLSVARFSPVPPLPVPPNPSPPALSMGVPMDIDVTRKIRSLLLWRCY